MRSLFNALAIVLSLGFATLVAAGPLEDGEAAYFRGDYVTALQLYLPLAEQGNIVSQVRLALMYANGHGVPQDYSQAAK